MIYYINENNICDDIFDCIIESSSIISDIRILPYETDLFLNESSKDSIKDKIIGFFKKIIQKVRDFFGKIKTFFQKSAIYAKIKSFKTKIKSSANTRKEGPIVAFSVPDPDKLDYEKTIIDIQERFRECLQQFMDQRSKRLQNIETDDTFDYNVIKDRFDYSSYTKEKYHKQFIKINMTEDSLMKYCNKVEDNMKSMHLAMDKLERDMISEINSAQQACVQNSNTNLNYTSAIISSALSAIQKFSSLYNREYVDMIDMANKYYDGYMSRNKQMGYNEEDINKINKKLDK